MTRATLGRSPTSGGGPPGRGRAAAVLAGVAALAVLLLIGLVVAVTGLFSDDSAPGDVASQGSDAALAPGVPAGAAGDSASGEVALAARPMLDLPLQASQPHALSTDTAGAPLALPAPGVVTGRLVPGGFPATPEGAVGQLAALTRAGLAGGDPTVYDAAYASLAEPGAPAAGASWMHQQMVELRDHAQIKATGPVPGLTITWTPTGAQVKGSAAGGSYVVACVLGELSADYEGRVATGGLGDCQALRRVGGEWRIASGPAAARAPSAWPGSAEAVAAGYREVR